MSSSIEWKRKVCRALSSGSCRQLNQYVKALSHDIDAEYGNAFNQLATYQFDYIGSEALHAIDEDGNMRPKYGNMHPVVIEIGQAIVKQCIANNLRK